MNGMCTLKSDINSVVLTQVITYRKSNTKLTANSTSTEKCYNKSVVKIGLYKKHFKNSINFPVIFTRH